MHSLSGISQLLPRPLFRSCLLHGALLLCAVLYHLHRQGSLHLDVNSLSQTYSSTTTSESQNIINFLELTLEQYALTEPQQIESRPAEMLVEEALDFAREAISVLPVEVPIEVSKEESIAAIKQSQPIVTQPRSLEVLTANTTQRVDLRKSAEKETARTMLSAQRLEPVGSAHASARSSSRSVGALHHVATQLAQTARPDYAYSPKPAYPLALRDLGVSGVVWLRVWVDETGRPQEIELSKGSGYRLFDEAALRAVQHWRFIPAKNEQKSLASWVEFAIRFEING